MWKEEKLWLQSTNKAKHENRKGILKSCQQEGSLCALFETLGPEVQFCFLSSADSNHDLASFSKALFLVFLLGSGSPASPGG